VGEQVKNMQKKIYRQISNSLALRKLVRGFTITELLVAVGLLAVVIAAAGMIFNYSIDAQRAASATAEIMRTLRSITNQLDADFAGIQKDVLLIGFSVVPNGLRADSIVLFATGDFQTTNTYPSDAVRGNVARIYYGQANDPDPLSGDEKDRRKKILARKQVILAPSRIDDSNEYEPNSFIQEITYCLNNTNEANGLWLRRPNLDPNNSNEIPMYFAKGVDNFSIMVDANVNSTSHSIDWWPKAEDVQAGISNYSGYPDLIKFTFTLYDSKGILKGGRRFEYIVYIGK
jgi:prepilin-type N-terminal cleavage/methylation domain-containing protein